MTRINWNLLSPAAVGNSAWDSFERGKAMGDEAALRGALADFSANPDDPNALAAVMRRSPELGMKLADYQDRRAYRSALSDYVTGNALTDPQRPALTPSPQPTAGAAAPNALMPYVGQGETFSNAFAPLGADIQQPTQPETAPQADFSFLGRPQNKQDAAFLRMLRTDPLEAIKIQSAMRDNFMDRVEAEHEFYAVAVDELSRMKDDVGWQAALRRIEPIARAIGGDLAKLPQTYPGPEGVQEMLEQSLPVKERLEHFLREANQEADNARADRNTDSLIGTREARLEETRRVNSERLANQRRGQDLTDARGRSSQRASGGSGGRSQPTRPTATDGQGNKVEWDGKAWVPVT